jgi:hypothetical protein
MQADLEAVFSACESLGLDMEAKRSQLALKRMFHPATVLLFVLAASNPILLLSSMALAQQSSTHLAEFISSSAKV